MPKKGKAAKAKSVFEQDLSKVEDKGKALAELSEALKLLDQVPGPFGRLVA